MGDVPLMRSGEETEFSYRLSICGPNYATQPPEYTRQFIPELKENPSLEFRILPMERASLIYVRPADWAALQDAARKWEDQGAKKAFWKMFPGICILALLRSLNAGITCLLIALGADMVLGLTPSYRNVFAYGSGLFLAINIVWIGIQYVTAAGASRSRKWPGNES